VDIVAIAFYASACRKCGLWNRSRLRENQRQHQGLLDLAKKADDIADYYKWADGYSGIAMFFYRFLKPVAKLD
jgi:hypothetical protein